MREQMNLFGKKTSDNKTYVEIIIDGEIVETIILKRKIYSLAQAKKVAANIVREKRDYYNGQWIEFGTITWNDKVYEDTNY
jgi:hypothetical protein